MAPLEDGLDAALPARAVCALCAALRRQLAAADAPPPTPLSAELLARLDAIDGVHAQRTEALARVAPVTIEAQLAEWRRDCEAAAAARVAHAERRFAAREGAAQREEQQRELMALRADAQEQLDARADTKARLRRREAEAALEARHDACDVRSQQAEAAAAADEAARAAALERRG